MAPFTIAKRNLVVSILHDLLEDSKEADQYFRLGKTWHSTEQRQVSFTIVAVQDKAADATGLHTVVSTRLLAAVP